MKQILPILLAGLILFAACTTTTPQPHETNELAIAEEYVRNAPTYSFDGMDLELIEYYVQESYPEQHVISFSFTSRAAGYGDRSDEMVAQVLTEHVIIVTVVEEEVTKAVIDGRWDELQQQEITSGSNENPDTPAGVELLSFQPMQCVEYAWDDWYAQGQTQYLTEPTTEELVQDYYAQEHEVEIGVALVESGMASCRACEICATSYYLQATVDEAQADVLRRDGWE